MEMKSFFTGMDRNARIGLIAGIALIVVATAGVLWKWKVPEPIVVLVAAGIGLVAQPLMTHA